jgi:3-isopropylmalate/(R)-2-methylmalate dehydratase small subunit
MTMTLQGKAHKVGDHIDTDAIIPARFLVTTDEKELGESCMEGLEEGWVKRVQEGDIMVAGENFGCGSSREHAPISILGAGMKVVVARSFARIFYRNSFNMGLLLIEIGEEIVHFEDGHIVAVDIEAGTVVNVTTGKVVEFPPLPQFMRDFVDNGGLIPFVSEKLEDK